MATTEYQRVADILTTGVFDVEEIKKEGTSESSFSSIEFYLIIHMTDEEYNYADDEYINSLNVADEQFETPLGFVYCFK